MFSRSQRLRQLNGSLCFTRKSSSRATPPAYHRLDGRSFSSALHKTGSALLSIGNRRRTRSVLVHQRTLDHLCYSGSSSALRTSRGRGPQRLAPQKPMQLPGGPPAGAIASPVHRQNTPQVRWLGPYRWLYPSRPLRGETRAKRNRSDLRLIADLHQEE